jgi:hypothetical protein
MPVVDRFHTMVDHGSSSRPMMEVSEVLAQQFKGSGIRLAYIKEYYNAGCPES